LGIIFSHPISKKLSFLGGTCLKIVYGLKRFSEDLDFDNKDLSIEDFKELSEYIKKELERIGFEVEIRMITKSAFYCYVKFPELLFKQGLYSMKNEKILIQLDTFDQKVEYQSDVFILDKFDLFKQIIVTPKSVILAQKLWTITQIKRIKGRDFYDIMFLMQNTKSDILFLESKFGTSDVRKVKDTIFNSLKDVIWDDVVKDVEPFLINSSDAEKIRLFEDFLDQTDF